MIKIKEWKANDMMNKVIGYGTKWQDFNEIRNEDGTIAVDEDGFVSFQNRFEIIKETEKAVYLEFDANWKEWFPKSAISYNEVIPFRA